MDTCAFALATLELRSVPGPGLRWTVLSLSPHLNWTPSLCHCMWLWVLGVCRRPPPAPPPCPRPVPRPLVPPAPRPRPRPAAALCLALALHVGYTHVSTAASIMRAQPLRPSLTAPLKLYRCTGWPACMRQSGEGGDQCTCLSDCSRFNPHPLFCIHRLLSCVRLCACAVCTRQPPLARVICVASCPRRPTPSLWVSPRTFGRAGERGVERPTNACTCS